MFTEVWCGENFLGTVPIHQSDWETASNWRTAAMNAARRVFGIGRIYYVVEKSHYMGEQL